MKEEKSRNRKGKIVQKEKAKEIQLEKGNKSPNDTMWKKQMRSEKKSYF